ncbi:ribose transport system permease protein [Kaistia hirudinis]|uniref:Ribose transport system permease protein n=1 Tax=Kaistia hirudinis TaxID=1293440 RepID=A0A840AQG8_9HYPH|nr:ABC transporter permease [Kaistia hirudinis]MBB3931664.1 ribose transport system permease protein [Kaistia hirudinis]
MNLARHRSILFAYLGLILLLVVTGLVAPGFLSPTHFRSLAVLAAFIGIVALGQTFVVIGGGIDLSVPWVLNAAAVLMTLFAHGQDAPLVWIVPLLLAAGTLVGVVNGLGVGLFGVPPIIMTLAVNVILQGGILVYTGGAPPATAPAAIQFLAVGRIAGFPVIVLLWIVLAIVATLLLSKTAFGRYLYAVGSSATVAEFSGVPTLRTSVAAYALSGFTAALAGMLLTGYSGQAYLGMGDPYLFTSIAAVAIGGASILGGSGHYVGTIAGALVLTVLTGLLPALNLSNGALLVVYGAVILVTVALASEALTDLLPRRRARRIS